MSERLGLQAFTEVRNNDGSHAAAALMAGAGAPFAGAPSAGASFAASASFAAGAPAAAEADWP